MQLIDAHAHIFPDALAAKASVSVGNWYNIMPHTDATSNNLIEHEKAVGACKCLVCSPALKPHNVPTINTYISNECKLHQEFVGFGTMHRDFEDYEEELDRVVSLGLKGIKFHHDMQGFYIDDPKMMPIYRAIADRSLALLLHMGDSRLDFSSPGRLAVIARQFPNLTIIGAHFGGYRRWDEVMSIPVFDNVYFDTSSSLAFLEPEKARELIEKFGVSHFFWGSDFPMWSPREEWQRFLSLGFDDETNQKIGYENFARVVLGVRK
ncbi:MAG: amidohydrolase family protein [Salinivirgaceae bacterium]|nr:amidohydrolase family protein [Salinivirgaceae bacterium]